MYLSNIHQSANRLFDFICLWILPIGYFLLLSALFFLPERSLHHKLFYLLFSIPTLIALLARPSDLRGFIREPIVILFTLFAVYAAISIAWSPSESGASSLIKRPLHTFMLFAGCYLLVRYRPETLNAIFLGAAVLALFASARSIYSFASTYVEGLRLIGSGALDNPLLSSHLFGFFATYWLCMCIGSKNLRTLLLSLAALSIMLTAVLATGSRTPLVALTIAVGWVALLRADKRSIPLLLAIPTVAIALLLIAPEMIMGRGESYRFEIWQISWNLILEHPLFGHGYDAPMSVDLGIGYILSEPHNFALGVLHNLGIVGFLPWLGMIAYGLYSGWKHRKEAPFVLASALLAFGIGAGLTEGGGILSRPKEHWFLLWIPLALIAALNIAHRASRLLCIDARALNAEQAGQLVAGGKVIEEDGRGPKVIRLQDGSFLKIFHRRRWYTSDTLNPYSKRFARNSQQLLALGFIAPPVLDLYLYPDGSKGVRYQPLPGRTLRQALEACDTQDARQILVHRLGRYIAQLHERGVYFRSLHLGNVLLLNDGELGLIDLADMRILPSSLSPGLRQRNLRHMQRYTQDRHWLFEENQEALLSGYSEIAPSCTQRMRQHLASSKNEKITTC
ncbi:bifunctional O-antigen ligase/aminoglycoside phosphotransferase family protein [Pseudomonas japonica]|uniref:O-antigen ligase n=1 Tax=Pseudomonas japonica TaxID=256466 RepID=A0A239ARY3_9PSED|nr:bifunctional O-antigen ligase/aminoglycoside phosphotransferase family protein [Pseudomonas japonica]SNR98466.1 O-antigen ligase [Pseudomonas japonica]